MLSHFFGIFVLCDKTLWRLFYCVIKKRGGGIQFTLFYSLVITLRSKKKHFLRLKFWFKLKQNKKEIKNKEQSKIKKYPIVHNKILFIFLFVLLNYNYTDKY